jgi:hypothetical protein
MRDAKQNDESAGFSRTGNLAKLYSPEWDLEQKILLVASFQIEILFVKFAFAEVISCSMPPWQDYLVSRSHVE